MAELDDLMKAARKGKEEQAETMWMDALEELPDVSVEELVRVARALVRTGHAGTAESLLWLLVSELKEEGEESDAFKAALAGLKSIPDSDILREEAAELYRDTASDESYAESLLELTLSDPTLDGEEAVQRLDMLEQLSPGSYVRVDPGARIGRVDGLEPLRGVEVEFQNGSTHFPLDSLDELEPVASEDVRALMVFEKGRLSEIARKTPLRLLTMVLNTFDGRMNLKRVRRYVKPVLADQTWAQWWRSAREEIERSPHLGSTGGKSPDLFVRSEPVSRSDQLQREFDRADPAEQLELALSMPEEVDDQDLFDHIHRTLCRSAAGVDPRTPGGAAMRLAVLAVLREMHSTINAGLPEIPEDIKELPAASEVQDALEDQTLPAEILKLVVKRMPEWYPQEWVNIVTELLPVLPEKAARICASHLVEEGHEGALSDAARVLLRTPEPHPGSVMWLWKAVAEKNTPETLSNVSPLAVFRKQLTTLSYLNRTNRIDEERRKALISRARNALLSAGESAIEEAVQEATDGQVSALMSQVERNQGLTKRARARVARSVRAARPELFRVSTPPWEQDVIYTTEEGRQRRQEEYDRIVNERMPEVIKEIGEAAEFGDLSENAEYTAALEERSKLSEKAGRIKDEISRSRIITREMASTPHVTVGSRVKTRDEESGEARAFTFLGPWDADVSEGIYSYQAPLSQKFMGKTTGDKV
ncbi:MAG: GreA/GreB family elongation factor, partial [Planctomycetota bacterium]